MVKKHKKFYTNHIPKGKKGKLWQEEADDKFYTGYRALCAHPLFAPLSSWVIVHRNQTKDNLCSPEGYALVTNNGDIYVNPYKMAEVEEWMYIIAHCLLHLGFGHFREQGDPLRWNIACDRVIACFLQEFKFGRPLESMSQAIDAGTQDEEKIYHQLLQDNVTERLQIYSTVECWGQDMIFVPEREWVSGQKPDWEKLFGRGLKNAVTTVITQVSGQENANRKMDSDGERTKAWFLNHFPLLGALAVAFEVIEDPSICQRLQISVAAVDAEAGKIFLNPAAFDVSWDKDIREEEFRFVMAHELLHVALRHHARRQGRDPFLWNVACDYVINDWLVNMGIGSMPRFGLLYDPELKGLNAEAIYDLITTDIRMYRKRPSLQSKLYRQFTTFRGKGACDILDGNIADWWEVGEGMSLDDFYRRALAQGFQYHCSTGRGTLPAGLIEEIMAIGRPPIAWDVELAQWFDAQFPPLEPYRSYARPSRRQSASPDIPRPRYVMNPIDEKSRTFAVVLDTSGSMSRSLIAKSLGSIASYAIARDVSSVRVIFCDAYPYDEGFMSPESIAGRVKIKGRGGTVLMPGIRLLEEAEDFPKDGPILIITDTECDRLQVPAPRSHAFLIPKGKRLPFPTVSPVFYVE